jgi:uncharacterized Zn-binding protein involved in type VI secretion
MKIHTRPIVSVGDRLECPIDNTAVKMDVFVKGRTEAVDEGDCPNASLGAATGADISTSRRKMRSTAPCKATSRCRK